MDQITFAVINDLSAMKAVINSVETVNHDNKNFLLNKNPHFDELFDEFPFQMWVLLFRLFQ